MMKTTKRIRAAGNLAAVAPPALLLPDPAPGQSRSAKMKRNEHLGKLLREAHGLCGELARLALTARKDDPSAVLTIKLHDAAETAMSLVDEIADVMGDA